MRYFTHKFFGEPEGIPARQVKVRIPLQVRGIGVEVVFAGMGAAVLQGRGAWASGMAVLLGGRNTS